MDKILINKISMYQAVISILLANIAKTVSIKPFASAIQLLTELVTSISGKSSEINSVVAGKAPVKNAMETSLIETTLSIAAAIYSYADDVGNIELKSKSKLSKSVLNKVRDQDLILKVKSIRDLALEHQAALVDYDVPAEDITAFEQLVDAYSSAKTAIVTGISQRTGARKTQAQIIKETDALLKEKIDKYMLRLKKNHSQFYEEYKAARIIRDLGGEIKKEEAPKA
ncbi:MAG: hypothetical protein HY960_15800 [Ignavibacteriae bacterium]|nr:hypothetical protein [Ignavibacteriota bacterium]